MDFAGEPHGRAVRKYPESTGFDSCIGHAAGTSRFARGSTGSARRCCHHAGYRVQDPKRSDLSDLLHANHLRNLHGRLLRRSFMLVVVTKGTNHDVAAEHGEEQQRGTQHRRAQPADQVITLSPRSGLVDVAAWRAEP